MVRKALKTVMSKRPLIRHFREMFMHEVQGTYSPPRNTMLERESFLSVEDCWFLNNSMTFDVA